MSGTPSPVPATPGAAAPVSGRARVLLACAALLALHRPALCREPSRPADPFAPPVTGAESRLLSRAMEQAATNTAAAIRLLENADPSRTGAAVDFALGNFHFRNGDLEAAARAYRSALRKAPAFRDAAMNLGRVYLLKQQPVKSVDLLLAFVESRRESAEMLVLLGHAFLMDRRPVSAESAYRAALLRRREIPEAVLGLARSLLAQARYAESLALAGERLQADVVNRELWAIRSQALLAMGDHDRAARTIEKARRLECADPEMLYALGDIYVHRRQPQEALSAYREAFAGPAPSPLRMLRAAEGLFLAGEFNGAEALLNRVEESQQEMSPTGLRLRGSLARQRGDFRQAAEVYGRILRQDPLDGDTLLLLADVHSEEGRLEEALLACERAARIPGHEAEALVRQAQIEVSRERYARAVQLLEAAQTFDDQPHVARYLEQLRRMLRWLDPEPPADSGR